MENKPNNRGRIAMFSMNSDPLAHLGSQESGGKETYVRSLAEELGKIGWDVDAFTRLDSLHKKQIATVNKRVRVIRLKAGPAAYVSKKELLDLLPELFNSFLEFNNFQNPYALFHSHRWDGGALALMAHEKFHKPFIHTFHTLGMNIAETKKRYSKDENEHEYFSQRIALENKIARSAQKIICLAEAGKRDLEIFYSCPPEKIIVIPGGVQVKDWSSIDRQKAREYLMIKPERFVVLFIGRFDWGKGLGTLVHGADLLRKEIPNLKVIIVGGKIFGRIKNKADVKEYARIQNLVSEKSLDGVVKFTGNVENKSLANFYQAADVLAVPSYHEAFGLVALEGMANKIPVVASNVGGLASIITHKKNGLLFDPRNPMDLKEKVMAIYKSKELAQRITDQAYQEVSAKYAWKDIAKKISEQYTAILA